MFSIRFNSLIKSWRNKRNPQIITEIKPFIDKNNWEGINYPSEKDDQKKFNKKSQQLFLMFCVLKKKMYILLMF